MRKKPKKALPNYQIYFAPISNLENEISQVTIFFDAKQNYTSTTLHDLTSYATIRHAWAVAVVLTDPILPDANGSYVVPKPTFCKPKVVISQRLLIIFTQIHRF